MDREGLAWTLVAVAASAFLAIEVLLIMVIVEVSREHDTRLSEVECIIELQSVLSESDTAQ